jgi:hypothetical protein
MSELVQSPSAPVSAPSPSSSQAAAPRTTQRKVTASRAGGFDAQERALAPVQRHGPGGGADAVHEAAGRGISGSGGALPHGDAIQQAFGGYDISHVTAHTDSAASEGSRAMGAEAYATGSHVAFDGAPDLHTAAHEAAHVVQQQAGVQLSGGVGSVGDRYEQHADKVADAVVAGRSAEPVLAAMARGGHAGASEVQQRASGRSPVQRSSMAGSGDVDSVEAQAVRDRTSDRGNSTGSGEMVVRGASQGVATVSIGSGSMAENPDFERDAQAFETQLGISAYSRGNGPAGAMAAKGKAYLMEKTGAVEWKATETKLAETLVGLGSDNPAWSGTVGKAVEDLLAVFDNGNVATRMCHLENMWGMLSADIKLNSDLMNDKLKDAGLIEADLKRHRDRGSNPFHIPAGSEVEGQGQTRLANPDTSAHRTDMTVGTAGVPLSPAEAEVQVPGYDRDSGAPPETARLQWEEGARLWLMNETNKWVRLMRQLSMPLGAGPSGTTNKLMNLGGVLGMAPVETRLACIGYLLPSHHHSLCEIMEAAAPHGASDFIRGRMMYTQIAPWSASELKGFGGGKFPHEGQRAAPVEAPPATPTTGPTGGGSA